MKINITQSQLNTLLWVGAGVAAFSAVMFGLPLEAFAQKQIGDALNGATQATAKVPALINGVAYTAGATSIALGAVQFKKAADNPSQQGPLAPTVKCLAGGGLLLVPSAANMINETTGLNGADSTVTAGKFQAPTQ